MAAKYPSARITGVSNSASQREFILNRAKERGLTNLEIVTCDMNDFEAGDTFERVVSIEMFEHMRNYEVLLRRIPPGSNRVGCCSFTSSPTAVMLTRSKSAARATGWPNLFSPRHRALRRPARALPQGPLHHTAMVVNGEHYQRTSEEWLRLTDRHRTEVLQLFATVYGKGEALKSLVRWRVFYIARAELFGYNGGNEWVVAHYPFAKRTDLR
jgi:cyclopropane-fatty-acyl-phospholipid synthase